MDAQQTLEDLPIEFEGPSYTGDTVFGYLIIAVSLIVLIIAVLIIMFGPEYVSVSIAHGPTFTQFWQLYPGPIATVAGIVTQLGWMLVKKQDEVLSEEVWDRVRRLLPASAEMPEGHRFVLTHLAGHRYRVEFEEVVEPSDQQNPPDNVDQIVPLGRGGAMVRICHDQMMATAASSG
ncbi:hypothetical protein [Halomonas sp. SCS19]|uniref:hypothetical protein n=1 Tax=Halomonas sp. SCS19 TaxID=2950870 RepID=UPI0032DED2FA